MASMEQKNPQKNVILESFVRCSAAVTIQSPKISVAKYHRRADAGYCTAVSLALAVIVSLRLARNLALNPSNLTPLMDTLQSAV